MNMYQKRKVRQEKNENNNVMWKFKIQKRDDGNCRKNGFIR